MKKLQITADLELKSEDATIIVTSDDNNIDVIISSPSAVVFPFKTYLKLQQYISLTKNLSQKIKVTVADNNIIEIDRGKIYYLKKWWIFKLLLKSIFTKV